jgi:hypothetical protein
MPDAIDLATYTVPPGRALILRTCDKDMCSHGGFQWPRSGSVAAPDWRPVAECGGGLHGFLRGEGDGGLASWAADAVWVVAEIPEAEAIDLAGKVKFPAAVVVYAGDRLAATDLIRRHYPAASVVGGTATAGHSGTATAGHSGTATAGYRGTATAGHSGTATAGYRGTATAGYRGTATAGDGGTATAGYCGTATAGYCGTATAGHSGTATAGHSGTATAGYRGTATAGYCGTATAGHSGTATAGDGGTATAGDGGTATAGYGGTATAGYCGTATAGYCGTATAGYGGTLVIKWYDGARYRMAVGYVGEAGIVAGKPYRLDAAGAFVPADAG